MLLLLVLCAVFFIVQLQICRTARRLSVKLLTVLWLLCGFGLSAAVYYDLFDMGGGFLDLTPLVGVLGGILVGIFSLADALAWCVYWVECRRERKKERAE